MERWIGVALAALALLVGSWNAWTLAGLEGRLRVVEHAASAPHRTEPPVDRGPSARAPRDPASAGRNELRAGGLDLEDPEVRERLTEVMDAAEERREQERGDRFRESVHAELSAFAEDEGLDADTTERVRAELDRRSEAFRATRDDIRSGAISWLDARAELEQLKETSDIELERLLGEERALRLDERLWGGRAGSR